MIVLIFKGRKNQEIQREMKIKEVHVVPTKNSINTPEKCTRTCTCKCTHLNVREYLDIHVSPTNTNKV